MNSKQSILIGKGIKKLASLRGGGSALPGLVIEKLDPEFLARTLQQLPHGVIMVTGTNGKTTTTKIVTELLEATGLKVFTNKTGSNFTRGVAAALLGEVNKEGRLPHDIAVLELDEAYAAHFVRLIKPRYVLVLNVMRDQLDRFGEIDHTAKLLETVAQAATEGVILNRDDPRVARIAKSLDKKVAVQYFGASKELRKLFVNDDELHGPADEIISVSSDFTSSSAVELASFSDNRVTYTIGKKNYELQLQLSGVYNFLNGAGALALCLQTLQPNTQLGTLVTALQNVKPAFGRGETITINGQPLEIILVKNPAGFRLTLSSFKPDRTDIMIAINDQYADGRDMSWLWDVDFSSLKEGGVSIVSGIRAYDMALRLQYDDIEVKQVKPELTDAVAQFVQNPSRPMRIFCTYTAMIRIRKVLKKYGKVEKIS